MLDFNEDGPAPVGASLRFLNRSRPYEALFSLSQHHLLHLVGNSQNKWACNYSPRVWWWWLLSCTPRPKKKKITIEWICNQTIQKRHKEKKKKKKKREIYSRYLAFDYCWPQLDYKERRTHEKYPKGWSLIWTRPPPPLHHRSETREKTASEYLDCGCDNNRQQQHQE
jgi:hypothetical protein